MEQNTSLRCLFTENVDLIFYKTLMEKKQQWWPHLGSGGLQSTNTIAKMVYIKHLLVILFISLFCPIKIIFSNLLLT